MKHLTSFRLKKYKALVRNCLFIVISDFCDDILSTQDICVN